MDLVSVARDAHAAHQAPRACAQELLLEEVTSLRRARPARRLAFEAALEERADAVGCLRRESRPIDRCLARRRHHRRSIGAAHRGRTSEALVEDAAEGPEVAPVGERAAVDLLGAHVTKRARARVVHCCGLRREAEVEHLDPTIRRHAHVLRLQVTMHDPTRVRRLEPRRHLPCDIEELDLAEIAHSRGEVRPGHILHRKEHAFGRFLEGEDLRHVRLRDQRERPRLGAKLGSARGRSGQALVEGLERHLSSQLRIMCEIDDAHAASPQLAQDRIAADPLRQGFAIMGSRIEQRRILGGEKAHHLIARRIADRAERVEPQGARIGRKIRQLMEDRFDARVEHCGESIRAHPAHGTRRA